MKGRASGPNLRGLLAKFDQPTSSWKTPQTSLFPGLDKFRETWPRWGMWDLTASWAVEPPAWTQTENESGYLRRPQMRDGRGFYVVSRGAMEARFAHRKRQIMLIHQVFKTAYPGMNRAVANPPFWESLMGWPIGWTDLRPLEMDKCQQWLHSHGERFRENFK